MDTPDFIHQINRYTHEFKKEPHKLHKFSIFHAMVKYIIDNRSNYDEVNRITNGSFRTTIVCKIEEFLSEGMSKRKSYRYIRVLSV
jgi:hypothetical protein